MMTRAQLLEVLVMESCQRIPPRRDPSFDDSPATCARRRAVLEAALSGFVYTTAAKRQQVKTRRHLNSIRKKAA